MPRRDHNPSGHLTRLTSLYTEIHECTLCFHVPGCRIVGDTERVRRKVIPKALESEVFLVGQALGRRTQRRSGLPYIQPDGSLSQAGLKLDAFLRQFGYTIDPSSNLKYVYSSDLIQHYPGRSNRGDRVPSRAERDNCAVWLRRELALVRPRVVLVLGKGPTRDFFTRYGERPLRYVRTVWGARHNFEIEGRRVAVFALPHFAYRFADERWLGRLHRRVAHDVLALLGSRSPRTARRSTPSAEG